MKLKREQITPKRILVIDNEPSILIAFKKIMQLPNTLVDTAETILEAMDMLNQKQYHLVLADLRLTGIDKAEGLNILWFVRQRDISVITALMTAYGDDAIKKKSEKYKVTYYMEKPVQPSFLRELVTSIHTGQMLQQSAVAGWA